MNDRIEFIRNELSKINYSCGANLSSRFSWSQTPQGHEYWSGVYWGREEITKEAQDFLDGLESLANEYREYFKGKVWKSTNYYYFSSDGEFYCGDFSPLKNPWSYPWVECSEDELPELHPKWGDLKAHLMEHTPGWVDYGLLDELCNLGVQDRMLRTHFEVSRGKDGFLNLYKNAKDKARGRKTEMKFGRAIRHMVPSIDDTTLEATTKEYMERYKERDYQLHVGKERKDFKIAYGDNLAKSFDPATSDSRKSLKNSCMRGVIVCNVSPAEVYASGEFHIAYLTNDEGEIAGRVVVWEAKGGKPQAGPVYGVCEQSLDKLEEYLKSINATLYDDGSSWNGAKILYLEVHGDVIGPYSDMEAEASFSGEYLELSDNGEFNLDRTDGYISGGVCCEDCGDNMHEEDSYYVEYVGQVCEHCINANYRWDDINEVFIDRCRAVEYHSMMGKVKSYGTTHEEESSIVYCECVDEYWYEDDVTYSEKYQDSVPTYMVQDFPEMFEEEEEEEAA